MTLYKTTIVIWSDTPPEDIEIDELAREAMVGGAYCSKQIFVKVDDPKSDPDWDGTEFFDMPEEG